MTVGNNKINYKGAFANFEELICKLSGTNMKCFKDLLAIKHKMRIVVQSLNNIHNWIAKQIPRLLGEKSGQMAANTMIADN